MIRTRLAQCLAAGGFLLVTLAYGVASLAAMLMLAASALAVVAGVGIVLLPAVLRALHWFARRQLDRSARLLGLPGAAAPAAGPSGGPIAVTRAMLTDRATWRAVRWLPANAVAGTIAGLLGFALVASPFTSLLGIVAWWAFPEGASFGPLGVALPIGSWAAALTVGVAQLVITTGLAWWLLPPLARLPARLTVALLAPTEAERLAALAERVHGLTRSRADVLDAHGVELRRIERDLHDGTQAQLVNLAMRLGVAEDALGDDPQAAARLLREARLGAEEAMINLRQVIRTIYPPVLADRGLAGAVQALAADCPVPTVVDMGELGPLPATIQAAAYFVVAESLTNVAKHSRARCAAVRLNRTAGHLTVQVTDDGHGGVNFRARHGRDRHAATRRGTGRHHAGAALPGVPPSSPWSYRADRDRRGPCRAGRGPAAAAGAARSPSCGDRR